MSERQGWERGGGVRGRGGEEKVEQVRGGGFRGKDREVV